MKNKTYRRAALEKIFLIALLILLTVWILRSQTVDLKPTPTPISASELAEVPSRLRDATPSPTPTPTPTPQTVDLLAGLSKVSIADIYAQACKEEAEKPWTEPTPLPGNRNRDQEISPTLIWAPTPEPKKAKPKESPILKILKAEPVTPFSQ